MIQKRLGDSEVRGNMLLGGLGRVFGEYQSALAGFGGGATQNRRSAPAGSSVDGAQRQPVRDDWPGGGGMPWTAIP